MFVSADAQMLRWHVTVSDGHHKKVNETALTLCAVTKRRNIPNKCLLHFFSDWVITTHSNSLTLIQEQKGVVHGSGVTNPFFIPVRHSTLLLFKRFEKKQALKRKEEKNILGEERSFCPGTKPKEKVLKRFKRKVNGSFCPITRGPMLPMTLRGQSGPFSFTQTHSAPLCLRHNEPMSVYLSDSVPNVKGINNSERMLPL